MKRMAIDVPVVSTLLRVNGVTAETPPERIRTILREASYGEHEIEEAVLMVKSWGGEKPEVVRDLRRTIDTQSEVPYPSPFPLPPIESELLREESFFKRNPLLLPVLISLVCIAIGGTLLYLTLLGVIPMPKAIQTPNAEVPATSLTF